MTVNLDDITKTSFCIPFKKPPNEHPAPTVACDSSFPSTLHPSRDLPFPLGNESRFEAYRVAWKRCLGRMQEIIIDLQKPTVDAVLNAAMPSDSRTAKLPGLPYPELPVIAVINPAFGPSLLHKIIIELETKTANGDAIDTDMDDSASSTSTSTSQPPLPSCLVLHFRAGDFPNVAAGMKSVVAGFVDKGKDLKRGERRAPAATSLAGYDIRYLEAWYRSLLASKRKGEEVPSKLVVILHDFEQFDPCVMQDVFYICCQVFPSLPLTFILSLSSPLPNFLNTVYPAKTLSLMRVRTIEAPGGERVLNEILKKTFFDVSFDPDILIGPSALEFLQDFFTRHHSSTDVLLTVLQLAHLKHFTSDPLVVLAHSTPSIQTLTQPEAANFAESLRIRLGLNNSPKAGRNDKSESVDGIIEAINKAREDFHVRTRGMRVGFGVMCSVQAELRKFGYKGLEWGEGEGVGVDVMIDLLRGRLGRDVRQLGMIVKKLKVGELESVLDRLNLCFFELPAHVRAKPEEQEARTGLIMLRTNVSQDGDVAEELSEWLKEYLSDKLRPLEELELWDVWYTRNTPPPSELLNPSVRACMVAGLLRPYEYAQDFDAGRGILSETTSGTGDGKGKGKGRALWELPDTSILFRRYLDSGRMINVFDWFESFKGVLEVQRRCGGAGGDGGDIGEKEREASRSPRKGKGKEKKSKGKGKAKVAMMEEDEDGEEWKLEVQARFIRALHELDYLGFVKHTGRKRDHVLRTLFEVGDDDEEGDDD